MRSRKFPTMKACSVRLTWLVSAPLVIATWLLATQPTPSAQDVTEAVVLATQACQASGFRHALPLRTLAVAYHIAGQEEAAAKLALQALTVAQAANDPNLVAQITAELHHYSLVEPRHKQSEEESSSDY